LKGGRGEREIQIRTTVSAGRGRPQCKLEEAGLVLKRSDSLREKKKNGGRRRENFFRLFRRGMFPGTRSPVRQYKVEGKADGGVIKITGEFFIVEW